MAQPMGLGKLGSERVCLKRKFRWLFFLTGVSDDGTNALPPDKGARPSLNFKEIQAEHLNETVFYPGKPDWKPVSLTLFDLKLNYNPVFRWLKEQYESCEDAGKWKAPLPGAFKKQASLRLYDGCGEVLEEWVFRNVWPNNIEWGDLDMQNMDYVTVEFQLRYDRAWTIDCKA